MTAPKRKTKKIKAEDYTHSVWSGKKYDRPMTQAELIAESMKVLRNHPAMGKLIKATDK